MLLLRFLYRNQNRCCSSSTAKKISFFSDFGFLQYPLFRSYYTIPNSITVDYLVSACGLSPKAAVAAAQKLRLSSVLHCFKNYGLTETQIAKIISKHPSLLLTDPDKILKPKFEFFQDLGLSKTNLIKQLCYDPSILHRGLKTQLIPAVEYLKTVLGNEHDVRGVLSQSPGLLGKNLERAMDPKIDILHGIGVPEANIIKLLLFIPRALTARNDRFNEVVNMIKEMGLEPWNAMFIQAVGVMNRIGREGWKKKLSMYKELDWSEEAALLMFRKQPLSMARSEKKTKKAVGFFMNKLNWSVGKISLYSPLLSLSMEKRIIPRCSVFGVLYSMGVLKRLAVKSALAMNEKNFLEKYVTQYQDRIPDVLKAYEGKIGFARFQIAEVEL